ncbi:hypothetical protein [Actinophytocola sediminis]
MTTTVAKRWPLLRVLLTGHLMFTAVLWVLFTVAVLVITGVIFIAGGVPDSVMHQAAAQAPRWLLFGLGIDVVSTYLRMQLAHGRTRREFTGQALAYAVIMAGATAVLLTVSYLIEHGVYAMFNLSQRNWATDVLPSAGLYPTIFGTYWLSLLLWTFAGLIIGLGFFRSTALGLLSIPAGIVLVAPSITLNAEAGLPFIGDRLVDLGPNVALAVSAGLLVVGGWLVWTSVRKVPMKASAE